MNPCEALNETFYYLPQVYLACDAEHVSYQLFVSVCLPPFKNLQKEPDTFSEVQGGVRYTVVDDPDGCNTSWVFQDISYFSIEEGAPLDERQVGVEIVPEATGNKNTIVHHADADEAWDGVLPA